MCLQIVKAGALSTSFYNKPGFIADYDSFFVSLVDEDPLISKWYGIFRFVN